MKTAFFCLMLITPNLFAQALPSAPDVLQVALRRDEVAIVLMHGKWGLPPAPLDQKFKDEGFKVISPEMGWSRSIAYGVTYEESLQRVNEQIVALRKQGVKKVVLGGQSFGANGALAYGSLYPNVDALVLFAPGHNPDLDVNRNNNPAKVELAKQLIASAQQDTLITFIDFNDGNRTREFSISPTAYLSYFDPTGLAAMPKTAKSQVKSLPVLVFMGRSDWVTRQGEAYFFKHLPHHPASRYLVSEADHRQVPDASFTQTMNWLETHVLK